MSIELQRLEVLSALFCTDQNCQGWKFYGRVAKLQTLEVLRSVFSDHRPLLTELRTLDVLQSLKGDYTIHKIENVTKLPASAVLRSLLCLASITADLSSFTVGFQ